MTRRNEILIGHNATTCENNTVNANVTINIHIYASSEPLLGRIIHAIEHAIRIGKQHRVIECASALSADELQGSICRAIEDR